MILAFMWTRTEARSQDPLDKPLTKLKQMNKDNLISTEESVNAAIAYLASKDALHLLAEETGVMGSNVCMWLPKEVSALVVRNSPRRRK